MSNEAKQQTPYNNGQRQLGGSYTSPYMLDEDGDEYESYGLAWRYLGVYMDCGSRRSLSWYNSYRNRGSSCSRKLLWAAYHDPNYSGGSIGEYQFYDWEDESWDDSTCQTNRCAKMDCHDPSTEWELVGVYKESVEFDNDTWFEQLFKHQGYCVWDGDKENYDDVYNSNYQFMQAMRDEMPGGCTEIGDIKTYDGKSYYVGIKPQSEGDMTLGVYTDSSCQSESGYSFSDYQKLVSGDSVASSYSGAFDRWNELMTAYKVCQPCRAYNRQQTYENRRKLAEEEDGQGEEEQYGYNCYDDADYRNCNQCYKFETHTDMEVASSSDLASASKQGTILAILYTDGTWYGSGTIGASEQSSSAYSYSSYSYSTAYSFVGAAALVFGAMAIGIRKTFIRRRIVIEGEGQQTPSTLLA